MNHPRILVLSGSTRGGSLNTKLAAQVAKRLVLADAEVTRISLTDFPLPLFNEDLEHEKGVPDQANRLKRLFAAHQGVFIACPEYNAGVTPLLKNTLDWISRVREADNGASTAFAGPVFAISSASPGGFGGMRGLIAMRTILEVGLNALLIPNMIAVSGGESGFTEDGDLADESNRDRLQALVTRLLKEAAIRPVQGRL